ncbi:hypothetical protein AL714_00310 [Clostridium botulinum]|uniref:HD domain-containing protein n=1 Tax=Clostridium botulinum TaxID=1491 RepID=UPI00099D7974|nr:hypothetical protein [Clostridium botulinum]OPD38844.1 hypothetical protein AL714_00310 [Clostridium botulinum]
MNSLEKSQLYNKIISDDNIYKAIYCVESYIFEKDLLNDSDKKMLLELTDKFNFTLISKVVKNVKLKIKEIVGSDQLFEISVYFRPKKFDEKDNTVIYRPLHTSSLINQIAIVSMLNILIYEYKSKELTLSNLSKLIPSNFYGNIPSKNPQYLFEPWQKMYKQYSMDSNSKYTKCVETGEYKYEILLDLVNFFPSVNPYMIYKYIIDKLSISYTGNNYELLKKVVFKLLYFKVNNLNGFEKHYYNLNSYNLIQNYSVGITQGLPQAYFFGNLCMIQLSKIFSEVFQGEAYYYVDDSVIFTNYLNGSDNEFKEKLNLINDKIKEIDYYDYIPNYEFLGESFLNKELRQFMNKIKYGINVHSTEGKSQFSLIEGTKKGEFYLKNLSKEASLGAMDIVSTFSDLEDITLKNKFSTLQNSIEAELRYINDLLEDDIDENEQLKNYKKKLLRFKKFFKFRKKLIEYREDNNVKTEINSIIKNLDIIGDSEENNRSKLIKFIDAYNEDIFLAEYLFVLRNLREKRYYIKIQKETNVFDEHIFGKSFKQVAYFSKIIGGQHKKNRTLIDPYETLRKKIKLNLEDFSRVHENARINWIIDGIKKNKYSDYLFSIIYESKEKQVKKYFNQVLVNTDEMYRMVLNAVFSRIFNVHLNDSMQISKLDSKLLTYSELRILVYLRNKHFKLNEFIEQIKYHIDNYDSLKLDYSIYEAIDYFKYFVRDPEFVDNLIQVHRYTCDMWKNGSKYMYFYTLHNEEHAIDLIKNSITFIKSVDYFQISKLDYYILFISCYLHDISMVLYPDLNNFLYKNSINSNLIYSQFKKEIMEKIKDFNIINSEEIKRLLLNYYKKIDKFFEEMVRQNHTKQSAQFIRSSDELNFLDSSIREIIAEISESHGYDIRDVYRTKSIAKASLVSKKFNKIILRVADLLDMSKDRSSKAILNNNISNMSEDSKFHWLSHRLITGYEIETRYINKDLDNPKPYKSYLKQNDIKEHIILTINVNFNQMTRVISTKCTNVAVSNIEDGLLELKPGGTCLEKNCNFICKWMQNKNKYLFEELNALQSYLSKNPNNYFDCEITVRLKMNKENILNSKYFDIITHYINE